MAPSLSCPSCRTILTEHTFPVGMAWSCSMCGAAWLDIGQSRALSDGAAAPDLLQATLRAEADAIRARNADVYRGHAMHEDRAARACPVCAAPLARSTVRHTDVAVDACPAHGTFLDAGELAVLAHHFRVKALRDASDEAAFVERLEQERRNWNERTGPLHLLGNLFVDLARAIERRRARQGRRS